MYINCLLAGLVIIANKYSERYGESWQNLQMSKYFPKLTLICLLFLYARASLFLVLK